MVELAVKASLRIFGLSFVVGRGLLEHEEVL